LGISLTVISTPGRLSVVVFIVVRRLTRRTGRGLYVSDRRSYKPLIERGTISPAYPTRDLSGIRINGIQEELNIGRNASHAAWRSRKE
jgi:hypothetical protein